MPKEKIEVVAVEEEMKNAYLSYALSVIMSRAIPDVRDGLKPSQRRILVAMHDLGLGPNAKFRKCAKIAGDTSGNYHPHGEQVVYPTLVRMAQDFVMRYPLVQGQGNFGSIDGDPPAAMRYTEARLSAFATMMLEDIDKNTVYYQPNYDETREEPVVLPGKFPNLVCNGTTGIAVGMAASIPPHNLSEVCDALIRLIANPETTVPDILKIVQGPDFPTGGMVYGRDSILSAYSTGRGSIKVRGKTAVDKAKDGRPVIIVSEIPYNISKLQIIEQIAALVKEEKTQDIYDIRDESDKEGIRIVIELKKGGDPDIVLNQLMQNTSLQDTFPIILIGIIDKAPKVLNIKDLLQAYLAHRKEVIVRRTKFLLDKALAQAHILEGLTRAVDMIDEIIKLIRSSESVEAAQAGLVEKFLFTKIQAEAILKMPLSRLTNLEKQKLFKDLEELNEKIAEYRQILSSDETVLDIIREDLYELKKNYGDPRRTTIVAEEIQVVAQEDLVKEEQIVIALSDSGFGKRVPLDAFKGSSSGSEGVQSVGVRENEKALLMMSCSSTDWLLFVSNKGKAYSTRAHNIPLFEKSSRGKTVHGTFALEQDENPVAVVPFKEVASQSVIIVTKLGIVKRTELSQFANAKRSGVIAISHEADDVVRALLLHSGQKEIFIATKMGMCIRFDVEEVRAMGRSASGVIGIRLDSGDEVVSADLYLKGGMLLTVLENGLAKRVQYDEYRTTSRGGGGIKTANVSERSGFVAASVSVGEKDEVFVLTAQGQSVRLPVAEAALMSRQSQGKRILQLAEKDKVAFVSRVINGKKQ